jgi:hypothetical protein
MYEDPDFAQPEVQDLIRRIQAVAAPEAATAAGTPEGEVS